MSQISLKKCTFTIKDGTAGTPNSATIVIGTGTFSWTENRNVEYALDRGLINSDGEIREGDEVPMDVSFEFTWTRLKSSTSEVATIEEAIKGTKSGWTSSDSDTCRPYACDIEILFDPCSGTGETYLFPDFRWESFEHSISDGNVSCSGKCFAKNPTITVS